MKRYILCLVFLGSWYYSSAQVRFEEGYIIDNYGKKHQCLIKNLEWRNNPAKIEYQLSSGSKTLSGTTENIQEFSVGNLRYQRFKVKVDWSSNQTSKLDYHHTPQFVEEDLFLSPLVEGDASLYLHYRNQARYYYLIKGKDIEPLIYKKFLRTGNQVGVNNTFRSQLQDDVSCQTITHQDLQNTDYEKKDLVNYFNLYNSCQDPQFVPQHIHKEMRHFLNIYLRPGVTYNMLEIQNILYDFRHSEMKDPGFRFGAELEFILPWNNEKWCLLFEPAYQYFSSSDEMLIYTVTEGVEIEYKSIDVGLGARYYFYLNEKSKLFVNVVFIQSIPKKSELNLEQSSDVKLDQHSNFAIGFGYNFNHRFSIEGRYQPERDILNNFFWDSGLQVFSIMAGFNLMPN
ncbi:MAG: hypothetical protein DHS20C17_23570 [Cyclobacteriaceae bacterium]|nr:MAG: hypothetical protein DHS20C17_23570 [Cyclobacteriaceae bacterium]